MLEFRSFSKENKVSFKTTYTFENGTYKFADLSLENVFVSLKIVNNTHIYFKREGQTKMNVDFILNQKTKLSYENNLGVIDNMYVKTNNIKTNNKNIFVDYDLYLDEECLDSNKIWIILKN